VGTVSYSVCKRIPEKKNDNYSRRICPVSNNETSGKEEIMVAKAKDYVNHKYAVSKAVRNGTLIKPELCSKCGKEGRINGHHEDYNEPLKVVWLCNKCHLRGHCGVPFDAPDRVAWTKKQPRIAKRTLNVGGRAMRLPVLKDEPCTLVGLFVEDKIVDEHKYFGETVDWEKILGVLTYREREIINLRYGLNNEYTYTLEEMGRIFKVTPERVRQIEAKAISKLREFLE